MHISYNISQKCCYYEKCCYYRKQRVVRIADAHHTCW